MQLLNSLEKEAEIIILPELAGTSPTIEPQPYILNKEEEAEIVAGQIRDMISRTYVDMMGVGLTKSEAEARIAETDWASKINKAEIFKRCNSNKHQAIWKEERRKAEIEEARIKAEQTKTEWTANRFVSLLRHTSKRRYGKELIVDESTLPLIRVACYFLSGDIRFETELGHSFAKGLYVRGPSGLGKTHVFECLKNNPLRPISILSMIEITDEVKAEGECIINPGAAVVYLDDVGSESTPVKHYGTDIHWFKDFIELWYARRLPFARLIISTNLGKKQIEEKYGYRVRSRMEEMFNIIDVHGEDMRK